MNTVIAVFANGGTMTTTQTALWQYDYGQVLIVQGIQLPTSYEVQFCNAGDSTTITSLGDSDGVVIPDQFLQNGETIYAYIYLHTGPDDGETEYKITIPVMDRAEPTDIQPTPQQESTIGQLVSALNDAVSHVDDVADGIPTAIDTALAEAKASGEFDGPQGEQGEQGPQGPQGPKGDKGDKGDPGSGGGSALFLVTVTESGGVLSADKTYAEITAAISADQTVVAEYNNVRYSYYGSHSSMLLFTVSNTNKIARITIYANGIVLYTAKTIPTKTSDLTNDSGFVNAAGAAAAAPVSSVNGQTGAVVLTASDVGAGTYSKPSGGIPATDLASAVQTSLGKADTALQSAPVSSVNGQTGVVTLTIPSTAADVGAVASNQGSGNAGKFLVVGNDGVVTTMTLATWQGGSY